MLVLFALLLCVVSQPGAHVEGADLFKAMAKAFPSQNIVFSPNSFSNSLKLLYYASSGTTQKQLENIFGFSESDKSTIIKEIFDEEKNISLPHVEYEVDVYNRIYHTTYIKAKQDKAKQLGDILAVFKTKNKREEEVNSWISKKTKGVITNLLPKGSLHTASSVVFVNAEHFKAEWKQPFLGKTTLKPFTLNDGTIIQTEIMATKYDFRSMVDKKLQAQIISLPYKAPGMSMVVIVPTTHPKKGSPPPIVGVSNQLSAKKVFEIFATVKGQPFCPTDLWMPKFETTGSYDFKPIFGALGATELLHDALDLTYLFEPGQNMVITDIRHGARVSVNENGTEATAATVIATKPTATHCSNTVHVDRPFAYFIYDDINRMIHFAGIVINPK